MKKIYINFLFASMFFINSLSARINPQNLQSEIEAIKIFAQHEFAQALLYKYEANEANTAERKQELQDKAHKSIQKLLEIASFLRNKDQLVTNEMKSLHSGYEVILPRVISDTQNTVKSYINIANSPTGY